MPKHQAGFWHIGCHLNPDVVDGVTQTAWALARQDAREGRASLVIGRHRETAHIEITHRDGVMIARIPQRSSIQAAVRSLVSRFSRPLAVISHSVYSPSIVGLDRAVRREGLRHIVRPAGGLDTRLAGRSRLRKAIYRRLVEVQRFKQCSAIVAVSQKEAKSLSSLKWIGNGARIFTIPNPVDCSPEHGYEAQRVGYICLARFDIEHKGIDRLAAFASAIPDEPVTLHTVAPQDALEVLAARTGRPAPKNFIIRQPVHGEEKRAALSRAKGYVHLARWEAFGRSIFEAMALGTPCLVSSDIDYAQELAESGSAIVLPNANRECIDAALRILDDDNAVNSYRQAGRDLVATTLSPERVLARYRQAVAV